MNRNGLAKGLPKGGTLRLQAKEEGQWVVVEIKDTGTGLDAHVLQRCFDPFFSTKGGKGTGLGLSIVHGIVRQHEGWIDIASAPGKGTTIRIRLPRGSEPAVESERPDASGSLAAKNLRVLAIDDESLNLKLIGKILKSLGFSVASAVDGSAGLKLFSADSIELVITDHSMPLMSGDILAAEIKKIKPTVPVVMLTGYADLMDVSEEQPACVDLVLRKPITRESITEGIAKVMAGRGKR